MMDNTESPICFRCHRPSSDTVNTLEYDVVCIDCWHSLGEPPTDQDNPYEGDGETLYCDWCFGETEIQIKTLAFGDLCPDCWNDKGEPETVDDIPSIEERMRDEGLEL